jgi:hypothetical protein
MSDQLAGADRALAQAAVEAGTRGYFAARRQCVGPFVDRHFSMRGTLRLHRVALGWDIARAPLNLSLAVPQVVARLGALAASRLGAVRVARALGRPLILETAVAREIVWLVNTELLELPFAQPGRVSTRDALAESILATPEVDALMRGALAEIGRRGDDPEFRARLAHAMGEYTVSRAAAAEITTGLLSLSAGALALQKLTPGAASLGPALAGIMAQQAAVASFPLGGWLGGVWYGLFPLAPSLGLVAGTTGGLMLGASVFAAFAGVVSDPVQRALGLHRRRLHRMINALERQVSNPTAAGFAVHDHYVARLLDVFDIVGAAVRLARI